MPDILARTRTAARSALHVTYQTLLSDLHLHNCKFLNQLFAIIAINYSRALHPPTRNRLIMKT